MNMTTVVDAVYSQSGGRGHKWLCLYSLCQVDGHIEDAQILHHFCLNVYFEPGVSHWEIPKFK